MQCGLRSATLGAQCWSELALLPPSGAHGSSPGRDCPQNSENEYEDGVDDLDPVQVVILAQRVKNFHDDVFDACVRATALRVLTNLNVTLIRTRRKVQELASHGPLTVKANHAEPREDVLVQDGQIRDRG